MIGTCVETGEPPWATGLLDLFGAASVEAVRRLRIAGFERGLISNDGYAKERYAAALTNRLKALTPALRGGRSRRRCGAGALAAVQDGLGSVAVDQPTRMMSARDVAEAVAAGHEIGAHS